LRILFVQEIQQNNPSMAEFITSQETRPEVNNKLSSLLITPIQRVPRYKLLLKEVLRHTIPRQQDYIILQGSLNIFIFSLIINTIINYINYIFFIL
jgi:hypothetical protein